MKRHAVSKARLITDLKSLRNEVKMPLESLLVSKNQKLHGNMKIKGFTERAQRIFSKITVLKSVQETLTYVLSST